MCKKQCSKSVTCNSHSVRVSERIRPKEWHNEFVGTHVPGNTHNVYFLLLLQHVLIHNSFNYVYHIRHILFLATVTPHTTTLTRTVNHNTKILLIHTLILKWSSVLRCGLYEI